MKNPPHTYISKLRGYLDPGVTRKKFRRRVQESTKVLRELEISLRTNHIGWRSILIPPLSSLMSTNETQSTGKPQYYCPFSHDVCRNWCVFYEYHTVTLPLERGTATRIMATVEVKGRWEINSLIISPYNNQFHYRPFKNEPIFLPFKRERSFLCSSSFASCPRDQHLVFLMPRSFPIVLSCHPPQPALLHSGVFLFTMHRW